MVLALVALSCGGTSTPEPVGCEPPPRPRDRLVLWHPFTEDDIRRQALDAGLRAFREAHPELTVETQAIPVDNLSARLGVTPPDQEPDAVLIGEHDLPRLADSGRTRAAQDCVEAVAGPGPERFWPLIRRAWSAHGRLWAVPYAGSLPLLWVNARRLAAIGRPIPRTRDELAAALAELRARTGRPGMRYDHELAYILAERWSAQRGQPLVDRDAEGHAHVHLDRPEVREDLVWLRDLERNQLVLSTESDASVDDLRALATPDDPSALAVHTSASAGYAVRSIEQGHLDPDLGTLAPVPLPDGAAGGVAEPVMAGFGFVLTSGERSDGRGAATLAAFLAEPRQQAEMAATTGLVPAVRGAEAEPALAAALDRHPPLRVPLAIVTGAPAPGDDGGTARIGPQEELRTTVIDAYRELRRGRDPATVMAAAQQAATRHVELYEAAHPR